MMVKCPAESRSGNIFSPDDYEGTLRAAAVLLGHQLQGHPSTPGPFALKATIAFPASLQAPRIISP